MNHLKTQLVLRDAGDNDILTLSLNGKERQVLARDVQRHVYRPDILHVDFLEVDADSVVRATVEVVIVGKSIPEQEGLGTTLQVVSSIEIEAKSSQLVSTIEANAELIDKPSRNLVVGDIVPPEGVTILTTPDLTLARFAAARQQAEEVDEFAIDESMIAGDADAESEE